MYEIFESKLILKETMKKVTWFFPFHPVTFYGQSFEKQKCLELVTSLFELQVMLTKISCWSYILNLETVDREGKKRQEIEWIEGKKHFSKFLKCFLLVKYGK